MIQNNLSLNASTFVETDVVRVNHKGHSGRLSLRARTGLVDLGKALKLKLPEKIGHIAKDDRVEILCLGPDEWVILTNDVVAVEKACGAVYDISPHSLVDISGREVTFEIRGEKATELLTIGMARDPYSIAVGQARRTVFDGANVIIWHDAENEYRMDVWNSFAPYIFQLLETGCRELAAEMQF